jgi:hypothetical protein
MDKLSVQTIVQDNIKVCEGKGGLNVYSLANLKKSYDDVHSYNAETLIKIQHDKREKKLDTFIKYYSRCFETIKILNNKNMTDMIFDVPDKVPECPDYNPIDCMDFIESKLKEKYMDIYRINYKTIFITWKYIEFNQFSAK